ncbi:APC family permease [Acidithiobacillus sp. M4-SHS-6]|uniref:APC family permease n=1 Tax=Acidithiobacillus sp. M4-SHS-6 TaxID=3383024 RepID=UPI0039BE1DA0
MASSTVDSVHSHVSTPAIPVKGQYLGVLTLTMMTAALFFTLRNMPMMAATGLQMVFFNLVTVFAFLIPIALVAAELATAWPKNGVFHWVEEAYGTSWGFTAIWLQWTQSIFGIASILAYVAVNLSYAFAPHLATNKWFIFTIILGVYWGATAANLRGTRASGMISTICLSSGVLFPSAVLIVMAIIYLIHGYPIRLNLALTPDNWLPLMNPEHHLLLFLSFIFGVAGIEVSAGHAREVKNVRRNYPIAVFSAALLGFVITLLGGLAIAVVVPVIHLNMVSGSIQALQRLFEAWNLGFLLPVAAFLIALGAAGQVSTWILGPIKGMWAASQSGVLPAAFQEANQHGVPRNLLLLQALLMSLVSLLILVIPVVTAFLLLTSLSVVLYCFMYLILFTAAIRLRYTQPDIPRPYRVPGGNNWGLWLVAGIGFMTSFACLLIGLIPPGHMSEVIYGPSMLVALLIMVLIPFGMYRFRQKQTATQMD